METGSPFSDCSQDSSQGLVQTLPQTAGKGFACLTTSMAFSKSLFDIRPIYAFTLIPAGHALVHLGSPLSSILYVLPSTFRIFSFSRNIVLVSLCFRSTPHECI